MPKINPNSSRSYKNNWRRWKKCYYVLTPSQAASSIHRKGKLAPSKNILCNFSKSKKFLTVFSIIQIQLATSDGIADAGEELLLSILVWKHYLNLDYLHHKTYLKTVKSWSNSMVNQYKGTFHSHTPTVAREHSIRVLSIIKCRSDVAAW